MLKTPIKHSQNAIVDIKTGKPSRDLKMFATIEHDGVKIHLVLPNLTFAKKQRICMRSPTSKIYLEKEDLKEFTPCIPYCSTMESLRTKIVVCTFILGSFFDSTFLKKCELRECHNTKVDDNTRSSIITIKEFVQNLKNDPIVEDVLCTFFLIEHEGNEYQAMTVALKNKKGWPSLSSVSGALNRSGSFDIEDVFFPDCFVQKSVQELEIKGARQIFAKPNSIVFPVSRNIRIETGYNIVFRRKNGIFVSLACSASRPCTKINFSIEDADTVIGPKVPLLNVRKKLKLNPSRRKRLLTSRISCVQLDIIRRLGVLRKRNRISRGGRAFLLIATGEGVSVGKSTLSQALAAADLGIVIPFPRDVSDNGLQRRLYREFASRVGQRTGNFIILDLPFERTRFADKCPSDHFYNHIMKVHQLKMAKAKREHEKKKAAAEERGETIGEFFPLNLLPENLMTKLESLYQDIVKISGQLVGMLENFMNTATVGDHRYWPKFLKMSAKPNVRIFLNQPSIGLRGILSTRADRILLAILTKGKDGYQLQFERDPRYNISNYLSGVYDHKQKAWILPPSKIRGYLHNVFGGRFGSDLLKIYETLKKKSTVVDQNQLDKSPYYFADMFTGMSVETKDGIEQLRIDEKRSDPKLDLFRDEFLGSGRNSSFSITKEEIPPETTRLFLICCTYFFRVI